MPATPKPRPNSDASSPPRAQRPTGPQQSRGRAEAPGTRGRLDSALPPGAGRAARLSERAVQPRDRPGRRCRPRRSRARIPTRPRRLAPNDPQGLNNLGAALKLRGRAADSIPLFRQALDAQHDYPNARFNLATALAADAGHAEAAPEFRRVLAASRPTTHRASTISGPR